MGSAALAGLAASLTTLLHEHDVDEWGVARNADWDLAPDLPLAVAIVMRHAPAAMVGIPEASMSQAFFEDYARLFGQLDAAAAAVVELLEARGFAAAQTGNVMSGPGDDPPLEDWGKAGVFAHKTAATQAGLGWIGKTAVFVSARFGPAVRLTTVFTDAPLAAGSPITESRCGRCRTCVDACPMDAGRDVLWRAGMPRDELYHEKRCEEITWTHLEWDGTCAVCQAVCPYTKAVKSVVPPASLR
jgi:epoxyqueuosine reductase QueG